MTLGERIAYYRKKAGYKSQRALSDALEGRWTRGQISNYELDINQPRLEFLSEFARITGHNLTNDKNLNKDDSFDYKRDDSLDQNEYVFRLLDILSSQEADKNTIKLLKIEIQKITDENRKYRNELLSILETAKDLKH